MQFKPLFSNTVTNIAITNPIAVEKNQSLKGHRRIVEIKQVASCL